MRKRTHHRPDDGPLEAEAAPVPAVLGDGPNGACGAVPPPFSAGVALELCFRAAAAARAAGTSGAAVGPNEEMFATEFADVRSNARSPATTFARFAAVGDAVDAAAEEDGAWSSADRDAGVEDVRASSVTAGVTPSAIVVPGAAAGIGGGLLSPVPASPGPAVVCVAPNVEAESVVFGAGRVAEAAGDGASVPRAAGTGAGASRAVGAGATGGAGVVAGGGAAAVIGAAVTVRAGARVVSGAGVGLMTGAAARASGAVAG
jgi:hypothetical protein